MTAADVIQQTQHKMGVTVEKLRDDFTRIRTGRASTGLLDKIRVDYYGCPTPLNQVAQVGVGDAHTLTVQPWEKNMVKVCEKAIRDSDLGLNPATSGDTIRVPLPPLTEERRRELTKVVKGSAKKPRWQCAICAVTPIRSSNVWRRIRKSLKTISVAMKPKSRSSRIALWLKSTR